MGNKIIQKLIFCTALLASILTIFVGILFGYVITGPRSLEYVSPYIEKALTPANSRYQVKIESSQLIFEGWKHPIAIHVRNVELLNEKNAVIAHFPEVAVRLHVFPLLIGRISLQSLEVYRPNIVLVKDEKGAISLGFGGELAAAENSSNPGLVMFASDGISSDYPLKDLEALRIRHATVSIRKVNSNIVIQSQDASFDITKKFGNIKGNLSLPFSYEAKNSFIKSDFLFNKNDKLFVANVMIEELSSSVFHEFYPDKKLANALHVPLSATLKISADNTFKINELEFNVVSGQGNLIYSDEFEKPIDIKSILLSGFIKNDFHLLILRQAKIDFNKFILNLDGDISQEDAGIGLNLNTEISKVSVDDIHYFWPKSLAQHSREWVTERISKGTAKGKASLRFKPGELLLKNTPKESVDARIEVKNATVNYKPKHPPVTDVNAIVNFTGDSMDASVSKANFLSNTNIVKGHLRFPDLNASDIYLFIDMSLSAPAKDAVAFMSLPDLNKAKIFNLTPNITGEISGDMKLNFLAFTDDVKNRNTIADGILNYQIDALLSHVVQPGFMGNRDINDTNLTLKLNNKGVKVEGEATINSVPMKLNITNTFLAPHETSIIVNTQMPVEKMRTFNLPVLKSSKGKVGINAVMTTSDNVDRTDATLDLTNAAFFVPQVALNKRLSDSLTLKIKTSLLASGNTQINEFSLVGNNVYVEGSGEIEKASGDISALKVTRALIGTNNLELLNYTSTKDNLLIEARGKSLDASYFMNQTSENSLTSTAVDIAVDSLILGEQRALQKTSAKALCKKQCHTVDVKAMLSDGTPCSYNVLNNKVIGRCDNAGELIRVLGIFDGFFGGKLTLDGELKDGATNGKLLITDYRLKNALILTKLFTIASLSGLFDTITGQGIHFDKLSAPFQYKNDVILLKDTKAYGSALGITVEGMIDNRDSVLDLKGTLVPSYTINSLAGNIPMIGDLLVGGEGKGLIAINYGIKGPRKDPSISVNPLSVFTPGFLRGIFNIFDKDAPDFNKIEQERKGNKADKKASQS